MAKLVGVLLYFVIIESSLALKCKKCEDKTCAKLIDESCPAASQDNKEPACLTHIYKDVNKVEIVDKMCAIKDKNAKYECVPLSQTEMVKCETCNTDFCNSAPSLGSGALATVGAVLAFFASRFM